MQRPATSRGLPLLSSEPLQHAARQQYGHATVHHHADNPCSMSPAQQSSAASMSLSDIDFSAEILCIEASHSTCTGTSLTSYLNQMTDTPAVQPIMSSCKAASQQPHDVYSSHTPAASAGPAASTPSTKAAESITAENSSGQYSNSFASFCSSTTDLSHTVTATVPLKTSGIAEDTSTDGTQAHHKPVRSSIAHTALTPINNANTATTWVAAARAACAPSVPVQSPSRSHQGLWQPAPGTDSQLPKLSQQQEISTCLTAAQATPLTMPAQAEHSAASGPLSCHTNTAEDCNPVLDVWQELELLHQSLPLANALGRNLSGSRTSTASSSSSSTSTSSAATPSTQEHDAAMPWSRPDMTLDKLTIPPTTLQVTAVDPDSCLAAQSANASPPQSKQLKIKAASPASATGDAGSRAAHPAGVDLEVAAAQAAAETDALLSTLEVVRVGHSRNALHRSMTKSASISSSRLMEQVKMTAQPLNITLPDTPSVQHQPCYAPGSPSSASAAHTIISPSSTAQQAASMRQRAQSRHKEHQAGNHTAAATAVAKVADARPGLPAASSSAAAEKMGSGGQRMVAGSYQLQVPVDRCQGAGLIRNSTMPSAQHHMSDTRKFMATMSSASVGSAGGYPGVDNQATCHMAGPQCTSVGVQVGSMYDKAVQVVLDGGQAVLQDTAVVSAGRAGREHDPQQQRVSLHRHTHACALMKDVATAAPVQCTEHTQPMLRPSSVLCHALQDITFKHMAAHQATLDLTLAALAPCWSAGRLLPTTLQQPRSAALLAQIEGLLHQFQQKQQLPRFMPAACTCKQGHKTTSHVEGTGHIDMLQHQVTLQHSQSTSHGPLPHFSTGPGSSITLPLQLQQPSSDAAQTQAQSCYSTPAPVATGALTAGVLCDNQRPAASHDKGAGPSSGQKHSASTASLSSGQPAQQQQAAAASAATDGHITTLPGAVAEGLTDLAIARAVGPAEAAARDGWMPVPVHQPPSDAMQPAFALSHATDAAQACLTASSSSAKAAGQIMAAGHEARLVPRSDWFTVPVLGPLVTPPQHAPGPEVTTAEHQALGQPTDEAQAEPGAAALDMVSHSHAPADTAVPQGAAQATEFVDDGGWVTLPFQTPSPRAAQSSAQAGNDGDGWVTLPSQLPGPNTTQSSVTPAQSDAEWVTSPVQSPCPNITTTAAIASTSMAGASQGHRQSDPDLLDAKQTTALSPAAEAAEATPALLSCEQDPQHPAAGAAMPAAVSVSTQGTGKTLVQVAASAPGLTVQDKPYKSQPVVQSCGAPAITNVVPACVPQPHLWQGQLRSTGAGNHPLGLLHHKTADGLQVGTLEDNHRQQQQQQQQQLPHSQQQDLQHLLLTRKEPAVRSSVAVAGDFDPATPQGSTCSPTAAPPHSTSCISGGVLALEEPYSTARQLLSSTQAGRLTPSWPTVTQQPLVIAAVFEPLDTLSRYRNFLQTNSKHGLSTAAAASLQQQITQAITAAAQHQQPHMQPASHNRAGLQSVIQQLRLVQKLTAAQGHLVCS